MSAPFEAKSGLRRRSTRSGRNDGASPRTDEGSRQHPLFAFAARDSDTAETATVLEAQLRAAVVAADPLTTDVLHKPRVIHAARAAGRGVRTNPSAAGCPSLGFRSFS